MYEKSIRNLLPDDDLESVEYNHDCKITFVLIICDLSTLCFTGMCRLSRSYYFCFVLIFLGRESQVRRGGVHEYDTKQLQAYNTQVEIIIMLITARINYHFLAIAFKDSSSFRQFFFSFMNLWV